MANVLLTEVCVRSCPYCFAKQFMEDVKGQSFITKENLIYIADFLEKSGINEISLLGGEPLLHPEAAAFIEYLIARGFSVVVFTSGIIVNKRFDFFTNKIISLSEEHKKKLTFMVNVNEPRLSPQAELTKVHKFLTSLHEFCSLSFNIYRLDFNVDFLIEYILKFGLRRHVRFGIANPIPGAENQYIHPDDFKIVKEALMTALSRMYELNIFSGLDCGFPLCMFSDDDIGKLYKYTGNAISFYCGPTIDIGPDLTCWPCFPLSNLHKKSLKDFSTYNDVFSYFNEIHQSYHKEVRGIYMKCDSCKNYDNMLCSGGCLAHILNSLNKEGGFRP